MRKSTIASTWLTGLGLLIGGLVVAGVGVGLLLTGGGTWTGNGEGGWTFHPDMGSFFWGSVATIVTGGAVFLAGGVVQFVAWIGALLNTSRSADKTWFAVLLVCGLVSILGLVGAQFVVMVVYLLAGPDVPEAPRVGYTHPPMAPPHPPGLPAT